VGASACRWAVAPSLEMLMEPSQIDPSRDKAAHMKQARNSQPQAVRRARCGAASPEEGEQRACRPASRRKRSWWLRSHGEQMSCMGCFRADADAGGRGAATLLESALWLSRAGTQATEMSARAPRAAAAAGRRVHAGGDGLVPAARGGDLPRLPGPLGAPGRRQRAGRGAPPPLGAALHAGLEHTLGQTLDKP